MANAKGSSRTELLKEGTKHAHQIAERQVVVGNDTLDLYMCEL
jgi:hypothetical protein